MKKSILAVALMTAAFGLQAKDYVIFQDAALTEDQVQVPTSLIYVGRHSYRNRSGWRFCMGHKRRRLVRRRMEYRRKHFRRIGVQQHCC